MHYQYQCACCKQTTSHPNQQCHHCGSHTLKRPFSFWLLCLMAGLATTIFLNAVHLYLNTSVDFPTTSIVADTLHQVMKK